MVKAVKAQRKQTEAPAAMSAGMQPVETPPAPSAEPATPARKRRSARRSEEVRSRILWAALELFGAHGFEGASTRAVAAKAGVSHTLLLYHFHSKENLWREALDHAFLKHVEPLRKSLAAAERPAKDGLVGFIEQLVRLAASYPQVYRILTMEGNLDSPRLQWVVDKYLRAHFTAGRDLIRRGQQEGTVREGDPARLYYLIVGAGGAPFTIPVSYKEFTNRDVFSEAEIYRTIAFILSIVFIAE